MSAVLAISGGSKIWDLGRRSAGLDFYQFWVVAQVAGRTHGSTVYDEGARRRIAAEFVRRAYTDESSERRRAAAQACQVLEPTATPFFYSFFKPLSGGSYEGDFLCFRLLCLASLVLGILLLARLLDHPTALALLAIAMTAFAFQPLQSDVRVGNVNQIQLGALAVYLWLSSWPDRSGLQIGAGVLLGALVTFKPNLLGLPPLLAAAWLLRGRGRKLALQGGGLAAGILLGVSVGSLAFGSLSAWSDWFEFLKALPRSKIQLRFGNVGLARLLDEVIQVDLAIALLVAASVAALGALWVGRRRAGDLEDGIPAAVEDATTAAAGILIYLLSAPMVWLHYMVLAIPAVLVALRTPDRPDGKAELAWDIAALAFTALAVDLWAELLGVRTMEHQAMVTSCGIVLLFSLLLREMTRWRRLAPTPPAT